MRQLVYLAVLTACIVGTLPLEFVFSARVYRRWHRAAAAILPVAVVFLVWDVAATANGWWSFNPDYVIGLRVANLPIEEVLFFVVIPVCAILTLEAVRWLKPEWAEPRVRSAEQRRR